MKKIITLILMVSSITCFAQSNFNYVKWPVTPYLANAKITAATVNTHTLTTTNLKLLYTGTTNGDKVSWVNFVTDSIGEASVVFLAVTDTTGGASTLKLLNASTFTNTSFSTTAAGYIATMFFYLQDLEIHSGQKLYAGATVVTSGSGIDVNAMIGSYTNY